MGPGWQICCSTLDFLKHLSLGMDIQAWDCPVLCTDPNIESNIIGAIQAGVKQSKEMFTERCQLLVCIIEKETKTVLYQKIKRICLCDAGVPSQVMLRNNVFPPERIKAQYIANVALKANIKIGGSNNYVDRDLNSGVPTMYVGLDVSHPSPGKSFLFQQERLF